jgi:hypothetical protein
MQNPKKSFDSLTAKKLISEYADKVNYYMKENQNLKNMIEDMKMSLDINKDLLFKYISTNAKQNEEISVLNEYKNDNLRLLEKIEKLHNERTFIDRKIYRINQDHEENISKVREELDKAQEEIFVLKNKLLEKETHIIQARKDSTPMQISPNEKQPSSQVKEILVCEPTKANVDMNNELNFTRELISKVSRLLNQEKVKNEKLEAKLAALAEKIENNKLEEGTDIININKSDIKQNYATYTNNKAIDINESLSSLDEDEDDYDDPSALQSPSLKFPDKVNYTSNNSNNNSFISKHTKTPSLVPKLDFKIIQTKYQSDNMKGGSIIVNKKDAPKDEASRTIEKIKLELKNAQLTIAELKNKLDKYKKAYNKVKTELAKSNEDCKNAVMKYENLENQIKKYMMTPSTDEASSSFKRMHNSSMVINIYY